ncbi:TRAP transporter substrate-binding protein [Pikeienuella piscinae]|uniref:TRAP transporter substrate-binding protein n=1 Tax=Pikeienuella piscinae TaxID=2748098 RepID=A0A7L5C1D0_9RHOB|nr:TRAP transporter substrate-binding protein [Pikeienuella piscinae]QIE55659.1 TRAP transporter substrate-binding protein [Pikeienuella piscinae]
MGNDTEKVNRTAARNGLSRRKMMAGLTTGAVATTLGAPHIAHAQETRTLRLQSTFPTGDIQHQFAVDYAEKVDQMSGGRLKIDVLPSGSVVRAFDLLDAVSDDVLDAGFGIIAYWYGRSAALGLWGTGPAFGMNSNLVLAWHKYGGGKELLAEIYKSLNRDVVSFLTGPMPTQPLGWFKKPVTSVDDLRGLKFRTVGLAIDMFEELGVAVNALPGSDIVPALDRGVIDAAEWNNPSSDRALGFPDVVKNYMMQSYHQATEQFEIPFSGKTYRSLSPDLQAILKFAAEASAADISWKMADVYSTAYKELQTEDGVNVYRTPPEILQAQLEAWERVVEKRSANDPMFTRVYESQREFAKRVAGWDLDTNPNRLQAYNFMFRNG